MIRPRPRILKGADRVPGGGPSTPSRPVASYLVQERLACENLE
jgi:hypothetical protein